MRTHKEIQRLSDEFEALLKEFSALKEKHELTNWRPSVVKQLVKDRNNPDLTPARPSKKSRPS